MQPASRSSAGSSVLPRDIYTNKGPVTCLADLAGTKIRIMESALMSEAMTDLGMIPVPLAATERYMALQTRYR